VVVRDSLERATRAAADGQSQQETERDGENESGEENGSAEMPGTIARPHAGACPRPYVTGSGLSGGPMISPPWPGGSSWVGGPGGSGSGSATIRKVFTAPWRRSAASAS